MTEIYSKIFTHGTTVGCVISRHRVITCDQPPLGSDIVLVPKLRKWSMSTVQASLSTNVVVQQNRHVTQKCFDCIFPYMVLQLPL